MDDTRSPLRIAAAQAVAVPGELETNLATAAGLIRQAGARGAAVVVFPELFLCGYELDLLTRAPARCELTLEDPRWSEAREACREAGVVAILGASLRRQEGRTLSSVVIDRRGEVCATYDKQHLWGPEKELFLAGRGGCTVEVDGWKLALAICYDASFPEHARAAALDGADVYVCSSAFTVGDDNHRRTLYFATRALENTTYVVFSNHLGEAGGWRFCGHSAIHGPDGRTLVDAGPNDTGLALADLDARTLARTRESSRMLRDQLPAPGVRRHVSVR